jgi:hypothetical protein
MQTNIALFDAAVERMIAAYPEKVPGTELRATDAPWALRRWNINDGGFA